MDIAWMAMYVTSLDRMEKFIRFELNYMNQINWQFIMSYLFNLFNTYE